MERDVYTVLTTTFNGTIGKPGEVYCIEGMELFQVIPRVFIDPYGAIWKLIRAKEMHDNPNAAAPFPPSLWVWYEKQVHTFPTMEKLEGPADGEEN